MLLLYTSQPLTSIASSLGFHSLSHFSKAFKAAEGISPPEVPPAGFRPEASEILRGQFSYKIRAADSLMKRLIRTTALLCCSRCLVLIDVFLNLLPFRLINRVPADNQHCNNSQNCGAARPIITVIHVSMDGIAESSPI